MDDSSAIEMAQDAVAGASDIAAGAGEAAGAVAASAGAAAAATAAPLASARQRPLRFSGSDSCSSSSPGRKRSRFCCFICRNCGCSNGGSGRKRSRFCCVIRRNRGCSNGGSAAGAAAASAASSAAATAAPIAGAAFASASEALGKMEPPKVEFDAAAARSAFLGAASVAGEVGSAAAAAGQSFLGSLSFDFLKFEIFRDFFQFLGIFMASIEMPEGFQVFFGNVSFILNLGISKLLEAYGAITPLVWYGLFTAITIVLWSILYCSIQGDLDIGLRMQATREEKEKFDWKSINKKSKFRFKKIKYLILALTSLYAPVSRNILQMFVCADKYAYARYTCAGGNSSSKEVYLLSPSQTACLSGAKTVKGILNLTDPHVQDNIELLNRSPLYQFVDAAGEDPNIIDAAKTGCFEGAHFGLIFVGVLMLFFFVIAFPLMMRRVIDSIAPKPIASDDPENPANQDPNHPLHGKDVIFNDEGQLIEYTDEIFLLEVRKHQENPYASLYTGFESNWKKYKVTVMGFKFLQLIPTVLLTAAGLDGAFPSSSSGIALRTTVQGLFAAAIMGLFAGTALKAKPYVDGVNDKMDNISRVVLFLIPLVSIGAAWLENLEAVFSIIMNLLTAVNMIAMMMLAISVMKCTQSRLKARAGELEYSDPNGISKYHGEGIPAWNLDTERKRRIWKPFWNRLFEDGESSHSLAEVCHLCKRECRSSLRY